jgi:hypothetical protein
MASEGCQLQEKQQQQQQQQLRGEEEGKRSRNLHLCIGKDNRRMLLEEGLAWECNANALYLILSEIA